MKLLLTGATGFIGSHLVHFFSAEGFEVHALGRKPAEGARNHLAELTDRKAVAEVFAQVKPTYFLHLAGRAVPGRDLRDLEFQIEDTIKPSLTLAQEVSASVRLALFFGSSDEYGAGTAPFRERDPLAPLSPYGWAKASSFQAVRMVLGQRGIPFTWVRPFLIYGPGQKSNAVVPSLIRSCLAGESLDLTRGEQTRDFLYVEDLARMVLSILRAPDKVAGEVFNLASGEPRTVRSVGESVRAICGRGELKFGALPYRAGETMSFYGSIEKFVAAFGAPSLTPFAEGLRKTIEAAAEERRQ